ncbi:MAG: Rieske 2Fe-2S domain-containing protein [Sphingomonadales bacterium]|nr:Rieske 2Fe-2S domain-containing protein [Sphingomonadales bacterium]
MTASVSTAAERFNLPIPFGWFAVARSEDLPAGGIHAFQLCGEEFVIWRGEDGIVRGLDAICPHLGAHLGHSSTVAGNSIRCPFHMWEFAGDGSVARIPYQDDLPPKLKKPCRERSLPIHEDLGIIFAWWHPHQAEPLFAIAPVPEIAGEGWIPAFFKEWVFDVHIQEITENSADVAHFPALHGVKAPPVPEMKIDGYFRYTSATSKLPTARGEIDGKIDVRALGPGLSFTRFWGITDLLLLQMQTPLDGARTHMRHVYFHPAQIADGKANVTAKLMANTWKQLEEDAKVWPFKRHLAKPLLVKNDGPIMAYREFYQRFYA